VHYTPLRNKLFITWAKFVINLYHMAGWQQRSCRELGNKYRVCISEAWNAMWQIPSWTTQWYTKYCNLVKHLFIFIFIPADLNCNIIIANSNKNNLTYKTKLTVSYDTRIHCDSYNAFYAWLPNIFPVYYVWKWHQTIAVYTMQAVKIVLPVYFLV